MALLPDKYRYTLPDGAVDALNVLYRTLNRPDGAYTSSAGGTVANLYDGDIDTYTQQASANGSFTVNYGTTNPIYAGSIGFCPTSLVVGRQRGILRSNTQLTG